MMLKQISTSDFMFWESLSSFPRSNFSKKKKNLLLQAFQMCRRRQIEQRKVNVVRQTKLTLTWMLLRTLECAINSLSSFLLEFHHSTITSKTFQIVFECNQQKFTYSSLHKFPSSGHRCLLLFFCIAIQS